jgi:WD40 repeat protein
MLDLGVGRLSHRSLFIIRRSVSAEAGIVGLLAILSLGLFPRSAEAQGNLADFADKPILVLDTGGHHAPVRKLVFTSDESRLLSAGDDKVVRVWDLEAKPKGLAWTIRPRIWRGLAGAINAMDLTPLDAQGQQTLALAGYGVESTRAEIGLYRFPGAVDRRQGDVEAYLPSGDLSKRLADPGGHLDAVSCLAFDPGGEILASSSLDQTVRLWNYRTRAPLAVLTAPGQGKLNALAFTPDGRRLATGGSDGSLRIWNVAARPPVLEAIAPPPIKPGKEGDPAALAINALGISRDGRWVVIGREDGALIRYDLKSADFARSASVLKTNDQQGPVEALAFGPSNVLATSIVHRRANPTALPTVACDVETRSVDEAMSSPRAIATTSNLVYALAYSSTGKYLAFAGGDSQGITLIETRPNSTLSIDLSESAVQGSSVWDIGFAGDGLVAYSYDKPTPAPPAAYWGFDLKDRSRTSFSSNQVQRAIPTYFDWTVRPIDAFTLEVLQGNQPRFRVQLKQQLDGRWWSYSFVPPGPKHSKPVLAVACEGGVVIHRLEDGLRTHYLDGHSGAVYCLAPSADGKWLATGSSDQTVRLWSLASCDVLAPFGAAFERRGTSLAATSVEKGGFAEVSGLKVGEVFNLFSYDGKPVSIDEFLEKYTKAPPNTSIQLARLEKRPGADGQLVEQLVGVGTTKRDRPLLSLFVGLDREWVLWTYEGYYDASVIGDARFLGWQINRSTVANPKPTEFLPILTFEKALRQPKGLPGNLIDALLTTANPVALLGPARPDPVVQVGATLPPTITPVVGAGGVPLRGPSANPIAPGSPLPTAFSMAPGTLRIDWKVVPSKGKPLGPFQVRQEGKTVALPPPPPLDPNVGVASFAMSYDLTTPGTYVFTAQADNATGVKRELSIVATVEGIPPKKPARLKVLAIAPTFGDAIPKIKSTEKDVVELTEFFKRHFVTELGEPFPMPNKTGVVLIGKSATAANVLDALKTLTKDPVEDGDVIVVVIETYVLTEGLNSRLVVSDTKGLPPDPSTMIPAEAISAALEPLVAQGRKVIVVLDGSHEAPGKGLKSEVVEWVRSLRNQYKIITVVATTRRPIRNPFVGDHRPLAESILDSIQWVGLQPDNPLMSLADFRLAIIEKVRKLTRETGEPAVYIPEGTNAGVPILNRKQ